MVFYVKIAFPSKRSESLHSFFIAIKTHRFQENYDFFYLSRVFMVWRADSIQIKQVYGILIFTIVPPPMNDYFSDELQILF